MKSLVILISGRGSNMQALLNAKLPVEEIAVISNNPKAPGLEIAKSRGLKTIIVDHCTFPNRKAFDVALSEQIDRFQPDLIALAGFMRILGNTFVNHYQRRLINIHPSLLPSFPGLNTHARVLQEGVKIHGCTVHFVTPQIDHGPVIIQAATPVLHDDNEQTLAARILKLEHQIFPQAAHWFLEGRLEQSHFSIHVANHKQSLTQRNAVIFSPGIQEWP